MSSASGSAPAASRASRASRLSSVTVSSSLSIVTSQTSGSSGPAAIAARAASTIVSRRDHPFQRSLSAKSSIPRKSITAPSAGCKAGGRDGDLTERDLPVVGRQLLGHEHPQAGLAETGARQLEQQAVLEDA